MIYLKSLINNWVECNSTEHNFKIKKSFWQNKVPEERFWGYETATECSASGNSQINAAILVSVVLHFTTTPHTNFTWSKDVIHLTCHHIISYRLWLALENISDVAFHIQLSTYESEVICIAASLHTNFEHIIENLCGQIPQLCTILFTYFFKLQCWGYGDTCCLRKYTTFTICYSSTQTTRSSVKYVMCKDKTLSMITMRQSTSTWIQLATSLSCLCIRICFLSGLISLRSVRPTWNSIVRLWSPWVWNNVIQLSIFYHCPYTKLIP